MTTTLDAPSDTARNPQASRRWPAVLAGLAATAVALGLSELLAGLVGPVPSLVYAIGNAVVDLGAGTPVKDIAIALFGTNEKTALIIGTVVVALLVGGGLGRLAQRRGLLVAGLGFAVFGVLGVVATTANPLDSAVWALVSAVLVVAVAVGVLDRLLGLNQRIDAAASAATDGADPRVGRGRRELLRIALGLVAVGGVAGGLGRSLLGRTQTAVVRADLVLPEAVAAPPAPAGAAFDGIDGLSPLFTPNDEFYRIDTALMSPVVDVDTWTLRITGMVGQEVELTYDDLLSLPQVEADVTIACVSNEVGGDLIGNARWQGVLLADVLDLAGVDDEATQIIGRSVDGWTAGFPTDIAYDGRNAMVAIAMNGEPLPVDHGFPARLIVPGLYGYVSATKWLEAIELTTWEAVDGYWIPRGWSKEGPVKTQSRIDVPAPRQQVAAGAAVVAGVAWAQHRGVAAVEVSVDDGPWQQAELAEELSIDTWRQWRFAWEATPGEHVLRVRATDGEGMTQSGERVPVAPDGAEGFHTRIVRVT